jgi:hypothetical protein
VAFKFDCNSITIFVIIRMEFKLCAEAKTPQNVIPPSAFYTRDLLLMGCCAAVSKLITAPAESRMRAIEVGTEVKITNGIDWIWVRIVSLGEPTVRQFDAVIVDTLPATCVYNAGSRVRIDTDRIFDIQD